MPIPIIGTSALKDVGRGEPLRDQAQGTVSLLAEDSQKAVLAAFPLKPASAVRIAANSLLFGHRRSFQIKSVPFLAQAGVREG